MNERGVVVVAVDTTIISMSYILYTLNLYGYTSSQPRVFIYFFHNFSQNKPLQGGEEQGEKGVVLGIKKTKRFFLSICFSPGH